MKNITNFKIKALNLQGSKFPIPLNIKAMENNYQAFAKACKTIPNFVGISDNDFINHFTQNKKTKKVLDAVFGNSPFLSKCIIKEIDFFKIITDNNINDVFYRLLKDTKTELADEDDLALISKGLRILKRKAALLTAIADITSFWNLTETTEALSKVAELCLEIAVEHQIKRTINSGELQYDDINKGNGLIILAMGKLGAYELNYSSDIDIIILYDNNKLKYTGKKDIGQCFAKITKNIIKIMEERTEDGYVFRTDLRTRPDPSSTPIAMSTKAAETYYESFGLNWERAAMIKAFPIAGDKEAGQEFLDRISPFVWRRTLDFQAIEDIHSIKQQLTRGNPPTFLKKEISTKESITELFDHDIKTGHGGIREIEFFAQIQQLIWGGRNNRLRKRATCDALIAMMKAGHIDKQVCHSLIEAYNFLRVLEHRLQMVEDTQTHSLPKTKEGMADIAAFMGYESVEDFAYDVINTLKTVNDNYQSLSYNGETSYDKEHKELHLNLNFSGTDVSGFEINAATIKTLEDMGYKNPRQTTKIINGWFYGRYRALRSSRAQNLIRPLIPKILNALSKTFDPDSAFIRFDDFLKNQPAGVQLFSMFSAKPALLDLISEIMGDAPHLANNLSKSTSLLGAIITPGFFDPVLLKQNLISELSDYLFHSNSYENTLDMCRIWVKEKKLKIGIQLFKNIISAEHACKNISDIADVALTELSKYTIREFAKKQGNIKSIENFAIVGLGKLGSREMTPSSDLDLIFIYDDEQKIEGDMALPPSTYFARLSQRLISAINAPTAEGKLWEIDMRLRPSGKSGPLATSLSAFEKYQTNNAWTWEHQALCKARVIYSSNKLKKKIDKIIHDTISAKRDTNKLAQEIITMRSKMKKEHKPYSVWDVKKIDGGMIDIEFIIQYLQLAATDLGANTNDQHIFAQNTQDALTKLAEAKLINEKDAAELQSAHAFFLSLQSIIRQTIGNNFKIKLISKGLKQKISLATGYTNTEEALKKLENHTKNVQEIYSKTFPA
ncbi:MAG: bifunctional [glutamine synthetase] adenylyltransferase/[glutamine synthetase]-adenylyl-L-tyrosine phosphorylase [Alphaproteobacteria bacterium]|nr:bifunctional [glutamine synthetase] adenylyltransferase/[glutamine synthetase]-adenylyl-L-tyrosine phosphorylase [Alphaproteobacteria bacterium]